jgi:hypothetical protein
MLRGAAMLRRASRLPYSTAVHRQIIVLPDTYHHQQPDTRGDADGIHDPPPWPVGGQQQARVAQPLQVPHQYPCTQHQTRHWPEQLRIEQQGDRDADQAAPQRRPHEPLIGRHERHQERQRPGQYQVCPGRLQHTPPCRVLQLQLGRHVTQQHQQPAHEPEPEIPLRTTALLDPEEQDQQQQQDEFDSRPLHQLP